MHTIYNLPIKIDHLQHTKLGKTITSIIESKEEPAENKKLAQYIKDKWSRIVSGVDLQYTNLAFHERNNRSLLEQNKKKSLNSLKNFNPYRDNGNPDVTAIAIPMGSEKLGSTFNFRIRPETTLAKRAPGPGATENYNNKALAMNKYLSKMKKSQRM